MEKKEGDNKEEEDNSPAPEGNGGTTDKYTWTQTLDEVICELSFRCTCIFQLILNFEPNNLKLISVFSIY